MSKPTIVTKLNSLVKGIFGRKDPVVTTVQDKQDETPAKETAEKVDGAQAPAETAGTAAAVTEAPAEASDDKSDAEPVKEADTESAQEKPASEEAATEERSKEEAPTAEAAAEAPATEAAEAAKLVEEPKGEAAAPATADLPEDGSALAEELEAAEANTTVASDEVLEKVRKGAAPAVGDLAVPTYDELTLPSVRARLRKLTIEQVRDLRAYEVAHESRPEFIKMYDNRIAKLEAEA